jgi:hypothetical protein
MKRISGGLGVLLSFAIGAGVSGGVLNYETKTSAPETQNVRTVSDTETPTATPTPTYDMTPPGVEATSTPTVEGDDGSLGGPVLNEANQAEPTYVVNTPEAAPTSENASDDTAQPEVTGPLPSATATATAHETPPPSPPVTVTPSADDHTPQESPSDTDAPTQSG